MTVLEFVAFVSSILGVWLTTRRSIWNFPFALLSVGSYAVVFHNVRLYADMALQGVFAATLLYGLWQWTRSRAEGGEVIVARVTPTELGTSLGAGLLAALCLGQLLSTHTDASLPWADSLLMAASLIGSFWAARRRLESWLVWILVDSAYVGLYLIKHLYLTTVLYAAFVILAIFGWRRWLSAWSQQASAGRAEATVLLSKAAAAEVRT